jgi:hypothetical protein
MESIEEQLDNFDVTLFDSLDIVLHSDINVPYWQEFEQLDETSLENIENVIDYAFGALYTRYQHVPKVRIIIEDLHNQLNNILWIAMDVPFPELREMHIDRVLLNCKNLFYNQYWERLEEAMIQEVSKVQMIQRNWKEAYYNPGYTVCKKRLTRECEELNACIREVRQV